MIRHEELLSGSYLLTFKKPCVEPSTLPLIDTPQLVLWGVEGGFVATTRVRRARVRNCRLSFPYLPSKPGRPQPNAPVETYFCSFSDIKPKREYATISYQVFLSGCPASLPVNRACRRVAKAILYGRAHAEKADTLGFWMDYNAYVHRAVHGAGVYDGTFWVLKRDGEKYKYIQLCTESQFVQLYEIATVFPQYQYFIDICNGK